MPPPGSHPRAPGGAFALRQAPGPVRALPRAHVPESQEAPELALQVTDAPSPHAVPLRPGQVTLLEMGPGVRAVRHRLLLACAQRGHTAFQVIGGQPLDSTGLARRALACGLDPAYVLNASVITRAFTAYQLSVLLEETLPAQLASLDHLALALVLDPLALYLDDEVPAREGASLSRQAAAHLAGTASEHDVPVLVIQAPVPDTRALGPWQDAAAEHVRVRPHPAGQARILERPRSNERRVLAEPGWCQATLDHFQEGTAERVPGMHLAPLPSVPSRAQRRWDASWRPRAAPVPVSEAPDG
ncbi:MAG: hypothetical protein R3185_02210 [Candidatus Thermoplasmatota archaeon]|nr:hypothetical protein [Candidatus Thermoplasmatota archaeon]